MAKSFEYLIVGGGNAAGYACREFVAQGVGADKVGVVSSEPVPPYERPALTKAYLHPPGAKVRARLPGFHTCVGGGGERQTTEWYAEKGISLVSGTAEGVDLATKTVQVGPEAIGYQKLLLATGTRALRVGQFGVPGDDLKNVFYVREERDAAQLVAALEALLPGATAGAEAKKAKTGLFGCCAAPSTADEEEEDSAAKREVLIVGGGYIGLECAAALVGWGFRTTMVFPEPHCMPRLFNAVLATWLEEQYMSRGVQIVKGKLKEFLGTNGKLTTATLKSGQTLRCDLAVVGVGGVPNVEFCSGLEMAKGGFKVDGRMQTSDPNVFAIGDVAAFPSMYGGELGRCEHVDHARKSASQAVKAAMGLEPEPYNYMPYFYSRVFEYSSAPIVFNFFGDQSGDCQTCPCGEASIGAIWVKDGKVVGALLMGSPGPSAEDQGRLRRLVETTPEASGGPAEVFGAAGL
mmetsp:Transcript_150600/g.419771  ORF Transcript_150600/g.419771 Transcript_150600/m.419771 type:complete len:462 (-) Transcript_150600:177-1562(-)